MNSIRSQLTVWYTVALGATVIAFGLALYVERRSSSLAELDQRLTIEADFVSQFLSQSYQVMGELTEPDPQLPAEVPESERPRHLVATSQAFLDGLADFLIVVDPLGHRLYVTDTTGARRPIPFDRLAEEPLVLAGATVEQLLQLARPPVTQGTGTLEGDPVAGPVRYLVMRVPGAGLEIGALVVATALTNIAFGPAQLLGSMLFILPVILLGSIAIGYLLAGTSFIQRSD